MEDLVEEQKSVAAQEEGHRQVELFQPLWNVQTLGQTTDLSDGGRESCESAEPALQPLPLVLCTMATTIRE